MKICHVITRMIVGGAQENTLLSCRGQLDAGHEVTLVTGPSPGPEGELLRYVPCKGLRIVTVPELVREVSLKNDRAAYRELSRFFREERFDVVHTHSSKAGIVGRMAARRAGVPCVVHTVHGVAFHPYERWWRRKLFILAERFAARRCDRIFTVAQAMSSQCVNAKIAPAAFFQVVYSGMEMERFVAAERDLTLRRRWGIPEEAPVIATLARLSPQKGCDFVPETAELVARRHPEAHFLLLGDGILQNAIAADAARRGLADRFHFPGLIPPEAVPQALKQADVLWHLSLHEGLPRSVVQALAERIPAVAFALDGAPEVLENGRTGYCVPAGDLAQVAAVTNALLDDPAGRAAMGEAGRRKVLEQFDWRRMSRELLEAYAAILQQKGGERS